MWRPAKLKILASPAKRNPRADAFSFAPLPVCGNVFKLLFLLPLLAVFPFILSALLTVSPLVSSSVLGIVPLDTLEEFESCLFPEIPSPLAPIIKSPPLIVSVD